MSALWSLTYLKADASIGDVFDTVVNAFLLEIDDKLYDLQSQDESYIDVKTGKAIVEKFNDPVRSRIIVDSCQLEWYNRGVIVYPERNGLFTLTDTIIHIGNIYESGRSRRVELAKRISQEIDLFSASLFLFMNFLSRVTKLLGVQAAHIMFERNPATRATSVHLYDAGQFIDDYYFEDMECDGKYGLIELPEKPDQIRKILDGRFAFLAEQPKVRRYDEEYSREVYFDGEDLGEDDPEQDIYNIRASQLYVPFWDETSLPFGAIYCSKMELPDYFLARYKRQ